MTCPTTQSRTTRERRSMPRARRRASSASARSGPARARRCRDRCRPGSSSRSCDARSRAGSSVAPRRSNGDATRRWAGLRLALERRNYRLFVAGQLVSLIGTFTQSIAQSWLVYRLTGSAFWLGVATFCQQAPAFLFASLGGLIADRHRRRTILVVTQSSAMVLAFALATLTLSGHVGVAHVLALAALLGAVNAVDSPTRQAFVPEMVGRENLASAVALNTTMVTGASFIGPAIAGVAVKVLGEGWCFLLNGASFLAVIAGLLAMRDLSPPARSAARESMWARLREGFRFAAT